MAISLQHCYGHGEVGLVGFNFRGPVPLGAAAAGERDYRELGRD